MLTILAVLLAAPAAGALDCKAPPALATRAKISCAEARKQALAKVPHASIASAELEEEHGKLVYSFDLRARGRRGVEEVQIDALSGKVVSVKHESPAGEAREQQSEGKSAK